MLEEVQLWVSLSARQTLESLICHQDLISYKVNQTNPLEIEECAIGDGMDSFLHPRSTSFADSGIGGLCGSIFLDTAIEKHIRTLVGETQYARIKPINKVRMMKMFEHGVKRCFTSDSKKDYVVDLRDVEDNADEGIEDEIITLKRSLSFYVLLGALFLTTDILDPRSGQSLIMSVARSTLWSRSK